MNNKIKVEDLIVMIDSAEKQEHIFFRKVLVVEYLLPNGFTIQGRAACVDPVNFVLEVGRGIARENAIDKLWQMEGYLLQQRLYERKLLE